VECARVGGQLQNGGAVASNGSPRDGSGGSKDPRQQTRPAPRPTSRAEFAARGQHQRTVVRRSGAGPAAAGHRRAIRATRGRRLPRWQWAAVAGFTRLDNSQLEAAGINPASLSVPPAVSRQPSTPTAWPLRGGLQRKPERQRLEANFQQGLGSTTRNTTRPSHWPGRQGGVRRQHGHRGPLAGRRPAATAAAATTRRPVVFNPAGRQRQDLGGAPHRLPATARAAAENGQIRRYEVKGGILSGLQEHAAHPNGRCPTPWATKSPFPIPAPALVLAKD